MEADPQPYSIWDLIYSVVAIEGTSPVQYYQMGVN
jgi:hypothetical protein